MLASQELSQQALDYKQQVTENNQSLDIAAIRLRRSGVP